MQSVRKVEFTDSELSQISKYLNQKKTYAFFSKKNKLTFLENFKTKYAIYYKALVSKNKGGACVHVVKNLIDNTYHLEGRLSHASKAWCKLMPISKPDLDEIWSHLHKQGASVKLKRDEKAIPLEKTRADAEEELYDFDEETPSPARTLPHVETKKSTSSSSNDVRLSQSMFALQAQTRGRSNAVDEKTLPETQMVVITNPKK